MPYSYRCLSPSQQGGTVCAWAEAWSSPWRAALSIQLRWNGYLAKIYANKVIFPFYSAAPGIAELHSARIECAWCSYSPRLFVCRAALPSATRRSQGGRAPLVYPTYNWCAFDISHHPHPDKGFESIFMTRKGSAPSASLRNP